MTLFSRAFGRQARPSAWRLLLAAALGALVASGLAPLGWWWLSMPALLGVTAIVAREVRPVAAAWAGWLAGAGYFAAGMFWIVDPFMVDAAQDGWMAPFALVFMSFGMALFWALSAGCAAFLGHDRRTRALAFAVMLAASGLLRTYVLTGFPWNLVGHIWVGFWPAQVDALVGPVGLSLMTTLAAALPLALSRWRGIAAAGLLLGAAAGYGGWRLAQPETPRTPTVTVRLVQPNAAQDLKWRDDMARLFFQRQIDLTAAVSDPEPDLIVWPETSVQYLLNRPGDVLDIIAEAAHGVPVALGIQRTEGYRGYNSLAVIDPLGHPVAVYDKHHLVPFGEYIPLGDLIDDLTGIPDYSPREGYGYSAGPGARVLHLGRLGTVLPLICYEAVFPQDLRAAPERADWILQITNDGWFGTLSGPFQHLAQARLRAIEQGLPLLRDANTGVSAVIDAKGRVLQSLPMQTLGAINAAVPPALPPTPYSRWGDWPMLALLILSGLGLMEARRRSGPPQPSAR